VRRQRTAVSACDNLIESASPRRSPAHCTGQAGIPPRRGDPQRQDLGGCTERAERTESSSEHARRRLVTWVVRCDQDHAGRERRLIISKLEKSSSGCEPRSANAKPGRSIANPAPVGATPQAMRGGATARAAGYQPRKTALPGADDLVRLGRQQRVHRHGEVGAHPAGCDLTAARTEEDDPATWEAHVLLRRQSGIGGPGDQPPAGARPWTHARPGEEQASVDGVGRLRARRAEADEDVGVGGPHTSDDAGERLAAGFGRAKAVRVITNFRRDPCAMH
jgi:hypothetical protein